MAKARNKKKKKHYNLKKLQFFSAFFSHSIPDRKASEKIQEAETNFFFFVITASVKMDKRKSFKVQQIAVLIPDFRPDSTSDLRTIFCLIKTFYPLISSSSSAAAVAFHHHFTFNPQIRFIRIRISRHFLSLISKKINFCTFAHHPLSLQQHFIDLFEIISFEIFS